jgi:hypothetical protein
VLKLVPVRTHLMVTDALTKSLPTIAHVKRRDVMTGRVPFCARTLRPAICHLVGGWSERDRVMFIIFFVIEADDLCALYLGDILSASRRAFKGI